MTEIEKIKQLNIIHSALSMVLSNRDQIQSELNNDEVILETQERLGLTHRSIDTRERLIAGRYTLETFNFILEAIKEKSAHLMAETTVNLAE